MLADKKRSILIVEDERIVAMDLQEVLAGRGYDAYAIASSADEAVSFASERCPDLVLMDIRIKGQRDGVETAEVLRNQFGVPIVYLTAHADDATVERAKKTEPYGYLLKPVKAAELKSAVEISLYKHEMEKRLRERERWSQNQLEVSDRLLSLGTMAAGVAHEVNNPLAAVIANASLVREEIERLLTELRSGNPPDQAAIRRLEEALEAQSETQSAASRIGRIVDDLKAFSRPVVPTPGEADVKRSIEWAVRSTSHEFHQRARVVTRPSEVPPVAIDEIRLGQVLVNLLINAARALSPGDAEGNEVSLSARTLGSDRVVIEVRDTGSGMSPEVLGRIFEPFFTTGPVGAGTGLGLSICHGIATSIGGDLQAESQVGKGSVFRLMLPTVAKKGAPAAASPVKAPVAPRLGRILVIDDDKLVLHVIGRTLKQHETVCVASAREALELLASGKKFDIILSDLMMPDMTGMEFYEALLESRPDEAQRVVFMSGGATNPKCEDFLASVPNLRLDKPFSVDGLRATVQQLLKGTGEPTSA